MSDLARIAAIVLAAVGVHLLWSPGPTGSVRRPTIPWDLWRHRLAIDQVRPLDLGVAVAASAATGLLAALVVFGTWLPAAIVALAGGAVPVGTARRRCLDAREASREVWPSVIEEVRVLTGAAGRSVPSALFEAGARTPPPLADAFAAAQRDWLVTMDFGAATRRLGRAIHDPAVDAVLETLVVAHEVGGTRLDEQLRRLADARTLDIDHRRDARAEQGGVRFARRFVVVVPVAMGAAGWSIGGGSAAYRAPGAQAAVALAVILVIVCWLWAGRHLRLPEPHGVLHR